MPARDITATSVVPPPRSTIILPDGSVIGRPAPIAAAIGSSTRYTSFAPADSADSLTALCSTCVMPEGMQIIILGLSPNLRLDISYKIFQHLFSNFKIGYDAVFHRTYGCNIAWGFAEHSLRLFVYRKNYQP